MPGSEQAEQPALTLDVFLRLADFVRARVEPLASGRGPSFDDTSRALRGLHHQVLGLASARVHFERCAQTSDPFERLRTEFAVCVAWSRLRGIAWEWQDHPGYRPEFDRETWRLAPVESPPTGERR
ncbi:hypothetical protein DY245_32155 [Streptomyces inhibens]|uniref:Uncharacterized protein n=1 Tax=Streptomyces inhibens TaxID=2293571 RepID=A0A371PVJ9_STRIH|nr:hypothetical protein [Streptomyces inhibens]REK86499.1 hypothetical protein DY245_32155 [Streptomyces inhibens]